MKVLRLREKLQLYGFTLLQHGNGYKVTNNSVKNLIEKDFKNLDEVKTWHRNILCKNRLNEEEAADWDVMYREFVQAEKCRNCSSQKDGICTLPFICPVNPNGQNM